MKTLQKLFAVLLTLAMVCSLGITCLAAGGAKTGSITLKDSTSGVSVAGKTYSAYKVLDATFTAGGTGVAYTVPAEMADFYAGRYDLTKTAPDFAEKVVAKIKAEEDKFTFARDVLAAAKAAKITPKTATAGGDAHEVKIDNLPFGFYVIEETATDAVVSAVMLATVKDVVVSIKADKPSIEKKIDGAADTDPSTEGLVPSNSAAIGDKVPYVLTSKVPDMTGYSSYTYVVTDTMSQGLTFNNDVAITIGAKTLEKETDFTVAAENGKVTITINNFKSYTKGDAIKITYSATLNENAVIGTAGNPNTVKLKYSNNPNVTTTTETAEVQTKTFVTKLDLTKVNEQQETLAGAEFELAGTRLNTVIVTGDGEPKTITKGESVRYTGTVNSSGKLTFTGLAAGTYTITELKAPDGYNILPAPISVTITCGLPENGTGNATWTVSENAKVVDGAVQLTVVNKTGTVLPETGGIGTTIFYLAGGGLMLAAAVLFITKKRMSHEE